MGEEVEKLVRQALFAARKRHMIELRGQRYRPLTTEEALLIDDFIDFASDDVSEALSPVEAEKEEALTRAAMWKASQDAEVARCADLRKALEPFAAVIPDPTWPDDAALVMLGQIGGDAGLITVGHLRAAQATLSGSKPKSSEQVALREALEGLLSFADTVVSCQESPHRGEWGHECPLCMGELVEQSDRAVIAKARAALEAHS